MSCRRDGVVLRQDDADPARKYEAGQQMTTGRNNELLQILGGIGAPDLELRGFAVASKLSQLGVRNYK
jgi:hypothetical protein